MSDHVTTVEPATGRRIQDYRAHAGTAVMTMLAEAETAQPAWADRPVVERSAVLSRLAALLRGEVEPLARLASREMGKPVVQARAEVEKCALACEYYAAQAGSLLADQVVPAPGGAPTWTRQDPVGVVLGVMPWNFPYWQVIRFAAPALVAGNACLLKHAPNVTGCALAIEDLLVRAGLDPRLFRTLVVAETNVPEVVAGLVADDRVGLVCLTGSEGAGTRVAAIAGENVTRTVLELGGSDPFVVRADADLDVVVPNALIGRFSNSGQSCLAAKRFLVHRDLADEFAARLRDLAAALVVGDPLDETTDVGPLARRDLAEQLHRQVTESVAQGARVLIGAELAEAGSWYPPTVLTRVTPGMPVLTEETFGPVAVVVPFTDDDEAVALANASRYGLAASVWGRDAAAALEVGLRIRSGALFVNEVVASDPAVPFGGTKRSGYGRELGAAGLREVTVLRSVRAVGIRAPAPSLHVNIN